MEKNKKETLIFCSIILCVFSFLIPIFLSSKSDSFLSTLSISLTAVGATATVLMLFIAISLYQKFGMETKFVERKVDKILSLVDLLKGKTLTIEADKLCYFIRFDIEEEKRANNDPYSTIKDRKIIINQEDYDNFFLPIRDLYNSYWLNEEIKEKIKFLEYKAIITSGFDSSDRQFVKLHYSDLRKDEWVRTIPEITVDDFVMQKNELIKEVEKCLLKYSDIKLNLRMSEPLEKNNSKEK